MNAICKRTISALTWLLLIIPLVLILVFAGARLKGEVPSLFGYSLYVIVSPSMNPELQVGDVILTEEYDGVKSLDVGDIITYRGFAGEMAGKLITHQIIGLEQDGEQLNITTKGTANPTADPQFSADSVNSIMKCKLPVVGKLYTILQKPWGFALLFVAPMLYFLITEARELKKTMRNEIDPSEEGGKDNE